MMKNFLNDDEPTPEPVPEAQRPRPGSSPTVIGLFDNDDDDQKPEKHEPYAVMDSEPESTAETIRRSGLAYSAGIAFFAAVVFMLILGWGADLLFGSSPWGVVVGIVLGSVIGFVQFFRITSQIFKK